MNMTIDQVAFFFVGVLVGAVGLCVLRSLLFSTNTNAIQRRVDEEDEYVRRAVAKHQQWVNEMEKQRTGR